MIIAHDNPRNYLVTFAMQKGAQVREIQIAATSPLGAVTQCIEADNVKIKNTSADGTEFKVFASLAGWPYDGVTVKTLN